jgi:hypothetical protein
VHRGAFLNTAGSDKDVLWHKKWSQQLSEDLKVVEHLRGKAMWEKTQLQAEALRSSVKLCQVGIEHMHSGAFGVTLL